MPLQVILDRALRVTIQQHPNLFERLSGLERPLFLIDATDLPYGFELYAKPDRPDLRVIRREKDMKYRHPAATIRGPFLALLELLQGQTDGDALFFSRKLVVEGDTEAVLSLRNAVDAAEIDLHADILSQMGPFQGLVQKLAKPLGQLGESLASDSELLQQSLLAPALKGLDQQGAKLGRLDENLKQSQKDLRKLQKRRPQTTGAAA